MPWGERSHGHRTQARGQQLSEFRYSPALTACLRCVVCAAICTVHASQRLGLPATIWSHLAGMPVRSLVERCLCLYADDSWGQESSIPICRTPVLGVRMRAVQQQQQAGAPQQAAAPVRSWLAAAATGTWLQPAQPHSWRGCRKGPRCDREDRHRGVCNMRAAPAPMPAGSDTSADDGERGFHRATPPHSGPGCHQAFIHRYDAATLASASRQTQQQGAFKADGSPADCRH